MRIANAGLVALFALGATEGWALTQDDPTVLVVGPTMPASLDALDSKATLVSAGELGEELTDERVDMVYIGTLPEDPAGTLEKLTANLPRDRALMLVINNCGWQGEQTELDGLQAGLSEHTEMVIAIPDNAEDCDAEAFAETFAAAAVDAPEGRQDVLIKGGYRLSGHVKQPVPTTPPAGALVITALPTEAMSVNNAAPVVLASVDPNPVIDAGQAVDRSITFTPDDATAPIRPGGPEPSVVLGDLAVLVAADARGPLGMPFEVREEIRKRDPAMFNRLLNRGAFDPVADQTNAAIQTELARMNCYSGGIDGAWGGGSAAALGRYFEQIGSDQSSTEPEIGVYRAIIGGESVTCPDVQPVAQANPTPSSQGNTTRSQPTRSATSAQQAAPQRSASTPEPQQQEAPSSRQLKLQPGILGTGVFK